MAEVFSTAALSPVGHVGPLLKVAEGPARRGDRVTVLTSKRPARQGPRCRRHGHIRYP